VNRTSARLAAIAESATLAVDAKAKALQAKGENVIGFGAGEPDFPTPANIVEAAIRACSDPKMHKYSPAAGLPALREAIAAKTLRDSGFECQASQVLVTNGGKHAVFTAFAALCDPGDEVICPAPYWTTYPEAIILAGGVPVVVQTDETTGFKVTVEQLDAALTPRTKPVSELADARGQQRLEFGAQLAREHRRPAAGRGGRTRGPSCCGGSGESRAGCDAAPARCAQPSLCDAV
jgi:aspartate/methionine/tyrosine aminotransferase